MNREYHLSILLPSAAKNVEKLQRTLMNLNRTIRNWNDVEVVMCLDADKENPPGYIFRSQNMVTVYAEPSKYRGRFFNAAWKASTGRWLLMANDDILFKTRHWDEMIPYDKYPDDLVTFGFRDGMFNEHFFCHPLWSRKAMEINPELFSPDYWITKCDNTIWDIHPPNRRIYLPEIELEHKQTLYGPEWKPAYEYDNRIYLANIDTRKEVLEKIMYKIGLTARVMIGIPTAEYARRADFYDHFNNLIKPPSAICLFRHGQSIANNRNEIVKQALTYDYDYVFFLDDDVICPPNTLFKLLEHNKDIVTALQLKRNYPHLPILTGFDDMEIQKDQILLNPTKEGLIRIKSSGLGAVLIKTDVFRAMEEPWFRLGELFPDQMTEDSGFYLRALDKGIEVYCDLDTRVGHIASIVVWPDKINGQWVTLYDTNGVAKPAIPQLVSEFEIK